ncbi:MAG: hypothetical protein IKN55_03030 [Oscillospiraceae bacterium]|nr:hypothetical protein [Oscillospiraceae bacterium]
MDDKKKKDQEQQAPQKLDDDDLDEVTGGRMKGNVFITPTTPISQDTKDNI